VSKRRPRLTRREREVAKVAPRQLVAEHVSGAPEVAALLRGEQTDALLMAMATDDARHSPGWKGAQFAYTMPVSLRIEGGSCVRPGLRMQALPGHRVFVDAASSARYGLRGQGTPDGGRL
jgi:hypothetical protein